MNCEHCGKEMYNTPVDGWFHKREQDAIDCFWWQKLTDKNSFLSYEPLIQKKEIAWNTQSKGSRSLKGSSPAD